MISAVLKAPGQAPLSVIIEPTRETYRDIVGGMFRVIYVSERKLAVICHEDAGFGLHPDNIRWGSGLEISGPLVVIGLDRAGNARSMTEREIKETMTYLQMVAIGGTNGRQASA